MSAAVAFALHVAAGILIGWAATWAVRRWHRRRWARQAIRDIHQLPTTTRERGNQ
ncbi:hypothetical protein [Streptomyces antimycoticus]|uniref:hypothetical protein n=1 Tax=Streptomyces antimycoticus TaxID=68175 RepID=UPI0036EE4C0B